MVSIRENQNHKSSDNSALESQVSAVSGSTMRGTMQFPGHVVGRNMKATAAETPMFNASKLSSG